MKNVNTFSGAVKAIAYEYKRQVKEIEQGREIFQETRRWDEESGTTISMRSKENAQDYRYFPEPDLGTIVISTEKINELKESIPEMPNVKAARWMKDYNLSFEATGSIVENLEYTRLFEETIAINKVDPKLLSNWILGEVAKYCNETGRSIFETSLTPKGLCELLIAIQNQTLSNAAAKKVFEKLLEEKKEVADLIKEMGLSQISDEGELSEIVKKVLEENQKSVQDYKNGKTNAFGFLMGQCMKETKGKGNPKVMKEELSKRLEE